MKICYCEDEPAQANYLKEKINQWAKVRNVKCEVDVFLSAEELLFERAVFPYDLMLFDISMKKMNGMELAKNIREKDKEVKIVFLTSDKSFVFDGYEVNALRYLMKPIDQKKLYDLLDYIEEISKKETVSYIILKADLENIRLAVDDVMYIEAEGHYVNIYQRDRSCLRVKEGFQQILQKFKEGGGSFIACHRSYAVNLHNVNMISRTECKVGKEFILPVSRGLYMELNKAFIEYNLQAKNV